MKEETYEWLRYEQVGKSIPNVVFEKAAMCKRGLGREQYRSEMEDAINLTHLIGNKSLMKDIKDCFRQ